MSYRSDTIRNNTRAGVYDDVIAYLFTKPILMSKVANNMYTDRSTPPLLASKSNGLPFDKRALKFVDEGGFEFLEEYFFQDFFNNRYVKYGFTPPKKSVGIIRHYINDVIYEKTNYENNLRYKKDMIKDPNYNNNISSIIDLNSCLNDPYTVPYTPYEVEDNFLMQHISNIKKDTASRKSFLVRDRNLRKKRKVIPYNFVIDKNKINNFKNPSLHFGDEIEQKTVSENPYFF